MLQIAGVPKDSEYEWAKGSKAGKGRKLVLLLVSEDSSKYCTGVYKRLGKEPKATDQFEAAKKKYTNGSIWKASKISFAKESSKYMGCSCKFVIDLNASTLQPVLQGTINMPAQATPPEDLSTLL